MVAKNRFARTGICPEFFRATAQVVGDHRVGSVKDGLARAVVLFEENDGDIGEGVLELEDVAHISATESIDGLIAIAHHTHIARGCGEHQHQFVLHPVGVLVLVDEYVSEPALVLLENIGITTEQFDGVDEEIIEIHRSSLEQASLVLHEDVGDFPLEDRLRRLAVGGGTVAIASWES